MSRDFVPVDANRELLGCKTIQTLTSGKSSKVQGMCVLFGKGQLRHEQQQQQQQKYKYRMKCESTV